VCSSTAFGDLDGGHGADVDRPHAAAGDPDDDGVEVREHAEREIGQVGAVGVAVIGAVQVRAGVADHAGLDRVAQLDPVPSRRRRVGVVAGPTAGAFVLLREDPQRCDVDPIDHQQGQRRDEQRPDLGCGHPGVRHVDAEVSRGQAAAVAEGHGRVELGAVVRLGHPPTMPPNGRLGEPGRVGRAGSAGLSGG
jgi:hypothetical protein